MNQGIEILLARMDSHPQEFDGGSSLGPYGRWTYTIERALAVGSNFTKEERSALTDKLRGIARERFTQDVMKQLLDGPEEALLYSPQFGTGATQAWSRALGKYLAAEKAMTALQIKERQRERKNWDGIE